MENYEEKYKKALEQAKQAIENIPDKSLISWLENIFPELHENEDERDERVRKELIAFLERTQLIPTETKNEWIAWLEKQGEQKPTPKFKIGDTIHKIGENTVFPRTIEKIEDGDYVCNNSHSFVNIKFQDDYELVEQKPEIEYIYPKFRIGDVIVQTQPNGNSQPVRVLSISKKNQSYCCESDDHNVYSSIPIRCENEYKLVEQKPAWSEEYEEMFCSLKKLLNESSCHSCTEGSDKILNWLKSIKPNHWKPSEQNIKDLE